MKSFYEIVTKKMKKYFISTAEEQPTPQPSNTQSAKSTFRFQNYRLQETNTTHCCQKAL